MRQALGKIVCIGVCVIGGSAVLSAEAQTKKPAAIQTATQKLSFTQITSEEISLLLADVAKTNPAALERMREDADARKRQLESIKTLLAFASEAQRDGLANEAPNDVELRSIRSETIAVTYDRYVNKSGLPFNSLSASRVAAYWGEGAAPKLAPAVKTAREEKFNQFLNAKIAIMRSASPVLADREISDAEREQAREVFAKIQIYADEYAKRSPLLPLSFRRSVDLQVKLQQAQFLAKAYSDRTSAGLDATEEEVAAYVKSHPELDTTAQRNKATALLARIKAGEDFAKLADEFSEDPGNKRDDQLHGGLYSNVGLGVMVPEFEKAALALQPGQVASEIVESDYGFHIIKLERRGKSDGPSSPETYDVRHILIATLGNPDAGGRAVPLHEYIRTEIRDQKEQKLIDELVARNKISVPADFVVPKATAPDDPPAKQAAPKRRPTGKRS